MFWEIGEIVKHDYVWNVEFGCYVGQEEVGSDEEEMQEGLIHLRVYMYLL